MPKKDPSDPNRRKKDKKGKDKDPYTSKHVRKMESLYEKRTAEGNKTKVVNRKKEARKAKLANDEEEKE